MFELFDPNKGQRVPLRVWLNGVHEMENSCLEQALNLTRFPFVHDHVALMPDNHSGYGMPIGGVLATKGVIIPNAVGVDIGCGMTAYRLALKAADLSREQLKAVMGHVREAIPLGFNHHARPVAQDDMPPLPDKKLAPLVNQQFDRARTQLGTLGGGNHFIELQKDENGDLWAMIHSGSRNLGKQICDHYNKLAVSLNDQWHSEVPKAWQLAYIPVNHEAGLSYIAEMRYCLAFAKASRAEMMRQVMVAVAKVKPFDGATYMLDIHHNYAELEHHYGEDVWVHRKGATLAMADHCGIIPGSQGTSSFIVKGKGSPDSFQSCSHGSGRKMSRTAAKATLNLADEIKRLDDQGIVHGIRNQKDLDEAAGSYKDIDMVMANQTDLVDVVHKLTPLAVVKG